ncbi:MAG: hypothetical protein JXB18_05680 [Sedimentisphaerales bacterium]|nr:hypothetical protein [Sedimentisphaerales bacterium]
MKPKKNIVWMTSCFWLLCVAAAGVEIFKLDVANTAPASELELGFTSFTIGTKGRVSLAFSETLCMTPRLNSTWKSPPPCSVIFFVGSTKQETGTEAILHGMPLNIRDKQNGIGGVQ